MPDGSTSLQRKALCCDVHWFLEHACEVQEAMWCDVHCFLEHVCEVQASNLHLKAPAAGWRCTQHLRQADAGARRQR